MLWKKLGLSEPLEAVIFDLDDTLLDWSQSELTWPDYLKGVVGTVAHHLEEEQGVVVPSAEQLAPLFLIHSRLAWQKAHRDLVAVSFAGILQEALHEMGVDVRQVDIQAALRAMDYRPMPGVRLFPDTLETLHALRACGLRLGILTNASQTMWMREIELQQYGLAELFDARITTGDTGWIKPHPAPFWRVLGMLQTTPRRAIFVGDSPEADIKGANGVGMTSIQFKPAHLNKEPKTEEESADYTITSLSQLIPIIEEIHSCRANSASYPKKRP